MRLIILFVFTLFNISVVYAQEFGSQIRLASHAKLIIIGEALPSKSDKSREVVQVAHVPEIYQAVVFRVDKVLKGNYSAKFIRVTISYDSNSSQLSFAQSSSEEIGIKYILLLNDEKKPELCKKLPDEELNDLSCYLIADNALIAAVKEEIEAVSWLINVEKSYLSDKPKKISQKQKKSLYISKNRKKISVVKAENR